MWFKPAWRARFLMASVSGTSSMTIKGITTAEFVDVATAGSGVSASGCLSLAAGAGAGGLFAATTGVSAAGAGAVLLGVSATLLTVESLGAGLVAGAASVAGAAGAALAGAELSALAGCAELSVAAGVALAAGESFWAKAALVKASRTRVMNRLSFDFMCLVSFWR